MTANVPAEMAEARDEEAVFVLALTKATTELEAFVTSDCKAKAPETRELSVRFLVPYVQI